MLAWMSERIKARIGELEMLGGGYYGALMAGCWAGLAAWVGFLFRVGLWVGNVPRGMGEPLYLQCQSLGRRDFRSGLRVFRTFGSEILGLLMLACNLGVIFFGSHQDGNRRLPVSN